MEFQVDAMVRDAAAFVQVPSVTGDERAALERLAELAAALGLDADLHQHDLAALRAHPDHPGEEAPRTELWGLTVTLPGTRPGRIALNGHVDVVPAGKPSDWADGDPFSGRIADGRLYGRGASDQKAALVAAAMAAIALRLAGVRLKGDLILQSCVGEEVGEPLVKHEEVNVVLFTGSYAVGAHIREEVAKFANKMSACEMGGKNAMIVAESARMEIAVPAALVPDSVPASRSSRPPWRRSAARPGRPGAEQLGRR